MAIAEVTVRLEYPETFDFEDLRAMFHALLDEAKAQGNLDLSASDSETGEAIRCTSVGQIWPDWRII